MTPYHHRSSNDWCAPRIHSGSSFIHFVCKWYLFGQQSLLSNSLRWWYHTYQYSLCFDPITENNDDRSEAINRELGIINTWLEANKLSLNATKTKYMVFHSINCPEDSLPVLNLRLKNVPIERVQQFDVLGLTISDTLTWKEHVNKIANKIAKSIGVMSRLKYQLDKTTLVLIYNSLVLPHFYFSILASGFESERLPKLQKKVIRTIHRAKCNAHTKPLMKEFNLLGLKNIFDIQCARFYYKFKHGTLPS